MTEKAGGVAAMRWAITMLAKIEEEIIKVLAKVVASGVDGGGGGVRIGYVSVVSLPNKLEFG